MEQTGKNNGVYNEKMWFGSGNQAPLCCAMCAVVTLDDLNVRDLFYTAYTDSTTVLCKSRASV